VRKISAVSFAGLGAPSWEDDFFVFIIGAAYVILIEGLTIYRGLQNSY